MGGIPCRRGTTKSSVVLWLPRVADTISRGRRKPADTPGGNADENCMDHSDFKREGDSVRHDGSPEKEKARQGLTQFVPML